MRALSNKKSEKYFYENKARLILLKFFDNIYSNDLILGDMPDLQDKSNSIGIEVTRAFISPIIPELQSLWKNHRILRLNEKGKTELKKNHISYSCTENKILVPMFWVSTQYLIKSFIVKVNKLNVGLYEKFNFYDLFIFSQEIKEFDIEDMPPLLDTMIKLQADKKLKYRTVYIIDRDIIYCYNLSNSAFSIVRIENSILDEINKRANI